MTVEQQDSELKEQIEERAEWLHEYTSLHREQSRVVAAREAGLSQSQAAELLDKERKTALQLWRQARQQYEDSRRLNDVYGAYFFSDWRA